MITSDYNYIEHKNIGEWNHQGNATILEATWVNENDYCYIVKLKSNTIKNILVYKKYKKYYDNK